MSSSGGDNSGSITVIGTSHVSPESIKRVENKIREKQPDVVAVELCGRRYNLKDTQKLIDERPQLHLRTLLVLPVMQHIQSRTSTDEGVESESTDMGVAINTALDIGASIALIDRDILKTFEELWDESGIIESVRIISSLGQALARGKSTLVNVETQSEYASNQIDEYLEETEEQFPTFKKHFVTKRDKIMAGKLEFLKEQGYDVVAVVGAAHKPGIETHISSDNIKSVEILNPKPFKM